MAPPLGTHRLASADLAALATGAFTAGVVRRLAMAELSKHVILVEALRRAVRRAAPSDGVEIVEAAAAVLAQVQAQRPDVVSQVLQLPHVGFWAATCLSRLRTSRDPGLSRPSVPVAGLAHLASFAAVAALRAGHPFQLTLPIRDGIVLLPTLGEARVGEPGATAWARVDMDHDRLRIRSESCSVDLPAGPWHDPTLADEVLPCDGAGAPVWVPATRATIQAYGAHFDVLLEMSDPFLVRLIPLGIPMARPLGRRWLGRLAAALRILSRHHPRTAGAIAAGMTTVVPLRASARCPASATSGWAWGAIALQLPGDALSLAQTLVHEFAHLTLAAADDVAPLARHDAPQLYYAPWRDDPRPAHALLQGTYAVFGVAGFWRTQRATGTARQRLRGAVEFARRRQDALDAALTLAVSPALTETGRAVAAGMVSRLTKWRDEPLSREAGDAAREMRAEHELRWRLANLRPDPNDVDALARAWLAGRPGQSISVRSAVVPSALPLPGGRLQLLELRYRDPRRLAHLLAGTSRLDPADAALLQGDDVLARDRYLRRVAAHADLDAWAGLILVRGRLANRASAGRSPATQTCAPGGERPEVAVAVHERIRTLIGVPPDAGRLIDWLAAAQPA